MVGLGTTCTSSMSATTPIMRCGAAVITGIDLQDRVGPHHMMVQRIAIGEHPLRYALAYNRDQLATAAVGIVEIASFDDRQAQRCEKSGRDDPNHARGDVPRPAAGTCPSTPTSSAKFAVVAPRNGRCRPPRSERRAVHGFAASLPGSNPRSGRAFFRYASRARPLPAHGAYRKASARPPAKAAFSRMRRPTPPARTRRRSEPPRRPSISDSRLR